MLSECFCGNSEPTFKSTGSNLRCAGDTSEKWRSKGAITVYKRGGPGVSSPTPSKPASTPKPPRSSPAGEDSLSNVENMSCYKDDANNRVLGGLKTRSNPMDGKVSIGAYRSSTLVLTAHASVLQSVGKISVCFPVISSYISK